MRGIRILILLCLVALGTAGAGVPRAARAQGSGHTASVLSLTVLTVNGVPVEGDADALTCRARPGRGRIRINNELADGKDGDLVKSFRSAVESLKNLPYGLAVDPTRWDLEFTFDVDTAIGGPSAAMAAGVTAFSAISGRDLRPNVAITGAAGRNRAADAIGGLEFKVPGAIAAGASMVIIPGANEEEIMELPMEERLVIPIFGIARLEDAILTSLSPADPAAKTVAAYLDWRKATFKEFGKLYREYMEGGGFADEYHWRLNRTQLNALYSGYFSTKPQAGGKVFAEVDASLRSYPWDIGLRSVFEFGKRIRMRIASREEEALAETAFKNGAFDKAYQSYYVASQLDPSRKDLRSKALEAAEGHFERTLKTTISAAEGAYREGNFAEAAAKYHELVESTRGFETRYPALERLAVARGNIGRRPQDPDNYRTAGKLALEVERYEDAARLLDGLYTLQPTPANAELLFTGLVQQAGDEPELLKNAVTAARQACDRRAMEKKPADAAALYAVLAKAFRGQRLLPEAAAAYRRSLELSPSQPVYLDLASVLVDLTEFSTEPAVKAASLKEADESLARAGDYILQNEAAYEIREELERTLRRDTAPPFLRVQPKPLLRADRPVGGLVTFTIYARAARGVAELQLRLDGKLLQKMDAGNVPKGTFYLTWDTRAETDGVHNVEILAGGVNREGSVSRFTALVRNPKAAEVYGDKATRFYHTPDCRRAPHRTAADIFESPAGAEMARYKPCFRCIR